MLKTASWFTVLPADHIKIGISRSIPRFQKPGYRVFRKLQPGPWFNSVGVQEYYDRYRSEVLAQLDPHQVADQLHTLAGERTACMVCFEAPGSGKWCHRALAAEWLAAALGHVVPEFGFEHLPQHEHPMLPPELRRAA
jgi:hypothetical protein